MSRLLTYLCCALCVAPVALAAQDRDLGAIAGVVRTDGDAPVPSASVLLTARSGDSTRTVGADATGAFRIGGLEPGLYDITVRRVGFRVATLHDLRVMAGRTTDIRVELLQSETRLSTVRVIASPTDVDVSSPAIAARLDTRVTAMLPTARDAGSLVSLVAGAREDQVWGGAGELANNVQLDGMAVNHPGIGGDFLRPSVDWIEALEVRGLGAGAADGNFQGGILDAITRSGSNDRTATIRSYYDSPSLTASNFNLQEDGAEQARRLEVGGEFAGPITRDRLFYFVGVQHVSRDIRVPALATLAPDDFRSDFTEERTTRGLAKLTWLPSLGARVDAMGGYADAVTRRFALTGFDDPLAAPNVSAPTAFWSAKWLQPLGGTRHLDVRFTGYSGTERRNAIEGPGVPGLQSLSAGREPSYQNAPFTDRLDPSSLALKTTFSAERRGRWMGHRLQVGGEFVRGGWERSRTRNGGVTWRPYPDPDVGVIDPTDIGTWAQIGSDWGGGITLDGTVNNGALFIEDAIRLGSRVIVTAGMRYGRWNGSFDVASGANPSVTVDGWDPRIGIVVDPTGRGTTAIKAHWGRYHQGMSANLIDRLSGVDAYENGRFYSQGPDLTDPRQTFTPEERDALFRFPGSGAPFSYTERFFDESGALDGYRQPYVDQVMLGVEKSLGTQWKAELVYINRRNDDFTGLRDRNLAANYTRVENVAVANRLGLGALIDPSGNPLVLPFVYVSNRDLKLALERLRDGSDPAPPGFSFDTIPTLTWNPDYVLTVIPEARRSFDQLSFSLRTAQPRWSALGSVTWSRLEGNVAGVTGTGGTGSSYTAGPWVRPNEAQNFDGTLPDFSEVELKLWMTARLMWGIEGGLTVLHESGEWMTPNFIMEPGRYRFTPPDGQGVYDGDMFRSLAGQPILLEERGGRGYADRTTLDVRAERRFTLLDNSLVLTADIFNVLGANEATLVKWSLDDRFISSANERYGAIRKRMEPRTVRIGGRFELW